MGQGLATAATAVAYGCLVASAVCGAVNQAIFLGFGQYLLCLILRDLPASPFSMQKSAAGCGT